MERRPGERPRTALEGQAGAAYRADVVMTSRLRRAPGRRHPWRAAPDAVVDLPVVLDYRILDAGTGREYAVTEATIDLRDGEPALVRLLVTSAVGVDVAWTQREFRWAGPLEVVTRLVPALIRDGQDPFEADYPVDGFPDVTEPSRHRRLSDEFLEDVARDYLSIGRGYARALAAKYCTSPRTVVSWVEKARERGILTPGEPGRAGGRIVPRSRRQGEGGRSAPDTTMR